MSATTIRASEAESPLVLAIDIGSSSARVVLYDGRARAIDGASAQEQYTIRTTAAGAAEDDPDLAIERAARCVDAVLTLAGPLAQRIGGVAVDTLASTFLALDAVGRPLTPLITYADTRNADDADALRGTLDEAMVHDRTGCLLRTSYWPARLAWFRRTQPEIWRAARRWATLGEYLELRLFGRARASFSAASWTGLLDRRGLVWDAPLLELLGVSAEQLAPLVDVDEPLSGLAGAYAARWPALRELPWFPAVGDGAVANVGSGCIGHSRVALTVGTTGAIRAVLPNMPGDTPTRRHADTQIASNDRSLSPDLPVSASLASVPPGLWCYRLDRRHALLGGATSEGGNIYAWMSQTLRIEDAGAIEKALAASQPDAHGLTVLPFLAGERSPGWAGDVRATIHGLGLNTTPIEILRAGLESVAYRFALIAAALFSGEASNTTPNRESSTPSNGDRHTTTAVFVASGGALLRSPAWIQIFADVLGRPVVASAESEATSRGAAVLALRALGALPAIEALPAADGAMYEPDAGRHAIYHAAIDRQRWLYRQLIGRASEPV
jgi:gluconokinase